METAQERVTSSINEEFKIKIKQNQPNKKTCKLSGLLMCFGGTGEVMGKGFCAQCTQIGKQLTRDGQALIVLCIFPCPARTSVLTCLFACVLVLFS